MIQCPPLGAFITLIKKETIIAFLCAILLAITSTFSHDSVASPRSHLSTWALPQNSLHGHTLIIPPTFKNHKIRLREWDGTNNNFLEVINKHPRRWQAAMLDSTQLTIGCAQGVLYPIQNNTGCGQPAGFSETILTWDRSRLSTPPHWEDLWNVVQLPGQRALPQTARITLEVALLADGIPPRHVYDVLSTPQGIEHAFHRLDQLRPYILWWRTPNEAHRLLQHRGFLMGVIPHDTLAASVLRRDSYVTELSAHLSLYTEYYWSVPNNPNHASLRTTLTQLDKNFPHFPDLPEPLPNNSLVINNNFWSTHAPVLEARFSAWLKQH